MQTRRHRTERRGPFGTRYRGQGSASAPAPPGNRRCPSCQRAFRMLAHPDSGQQKTPVKPRACRGSLSGRQVADVSSAGLPADVRETYLMNTPLMRCSAQSRLEPPSRSAGIGTTRRRGRRVPFRDISNVFDKFVLSFTRRGIAPPRKGGALYAPLLKMSRACAGQSEIPTNARRRHFAMRLRGTLAAWISNRSDVSDGLGLGSNSRSLRSVTASYSVAPSALPVKGAGFQTGHGRSSIHENLEPAEDHALAVEGHRARVRLESGIGHDLRHGFVVRFA